MDKKIKEYIAENKLTDEDIYKLLTADNGDADAAGTPDANKDNHEVEQNATPEHTTVEKPGTATPEKKDESTFTMEELNKLVADKIAEHDNTKAKEQTLFAPEIDNPRTEKPRYRILKMNN